MFGLTPKGSHEYSIKKLKGQTPREALSHLLSNFAWDWFLTATFKGEFTASAGRRAVQSYFTKLEDRFRTPIPRFWCQEYGMVIEFGPHFHALLGQVKHIKNSAKIAHSLWIKHRGHGALRTESYREELGAGYYLTKYVTKDSFQAGDWGLDILDKL